MRNHGKVVPVVLAVAASLIFAVPRTVEAQTCKIDGRKVPIQKWAADGQPPDWADGMVINAVDEPLPARVFPECNPANYAGGLIARIDVGCDQEHFHGTLSGQSDPAPSTCGQFKVIATGPAGTFLGSVADTTASSHTARRTYTERKDPTPCTAVPFTTFLNPCWPRGAGSEIQRAANRLKGALRNIDGSCSACSPSTRDLLKSKTRNVIRIYAEDAIPSERRRDRVGACNAYDDAQGLMRDIWSLASSCCDE